jgi:hypothetical protein
LLITFAREPGPACTDPHPPTSVGR